MDVAAFQALLAPAGQAALQAAQALSPREVDFLAHLTTLSRRFPVELSRAALEIAILRLEAAAKFPFADRLYLTRPALEQATSYPVSRYRAERFGGFPRTLDLGCSVGGDTLALARAGLQVTGVDLDPLRLAMAQANLGALGLAQRAALVQADLRQALPFSLSAQSALFFDPARRAPDTRPGEGRGSSRRVFSVRDYQPPLEIVHGWLPRCSALAVKISPGVNLAELGGLLHGPPAAPEVEFISLAGELKEAVLWFGPLATAARRATLLERNGDRHTLSGPPDDAPGSSLLPLAEPQAYLYEPDPAVLRAGLVGLLGRQLGAAQLDPDIAYLTSSQLQPTPFARHWTVEAWFPFSVKRLRLALRERHVGRVTVKKRGSPLEPQQLIRDLRLQGSEERVVFLTHLQGRPIVILAYPAGASGSFPPGG